MVSWKRRWICFPKVSGYCFCRIFNFFPGLCTENTCIIKMKFIGFFFNLFLVSFESEFATDCIKNILDLNFLELFNLLNKRHIFYNNELIEFGHQYFQLRTRSVLCIFSCVQTSSCRFSCCVRKLQRSIE